MPKYLLLLICLLHWHTANAQKRIVVYDLETRTPIQKTRIRVDRMRTFSTDLRGTFVTPIKFDTLEISGAKYLTCKVAYKAVGDSIGLIPNAHNLSEVVIYGEDLAKKLNNNIDRWTTQDLQEIVMQNSNGGVGIDLVSLLDFKGRARAKRTRKVKSALEKLDVDSEDPIEQAYINAMKQKQKQAGETKE